MPRDGSNIYHRPPGTDGVPNTTIASTPYNGYVADIEQDLNLPRPIVAGGTGATNATDAMTSLQGDKAYQVVTNYDSYAFISGSFYSAAGATSAPTGNAFIGHCYTSDPAVMPPTAPASANMFIEARDVITGLNYVRQKTASVWGTWKQQDAVSISFTPAGNIAATTVQAAIVELDNEKVAKAGDTMTGPLVLPADPTLPLQSSTKQYVDALITNTATGAVAYTAQTPTVAQQTIARRNIYAAPFDAMAYNGMQVNGSCEVAQELGVSLIALVNNSGRYAIDGWIAGYSNAAATASFTVQQTVSPFLGFMNCLTLKSVAQLSPVGANDFASLYMPLENYRTFRVGLGNAGAWPVTVGFLIQATAGGTMAVELRNAAGTRSCTIDVPVGVNVPEYKTVTFPPDTAGTAPWAPGATGVSAYLFFNFAAGSASRAGTGAWLSSDQRGTTNTTNFFATNGNQVSITGVTVLPGNQAPSLLGSPLIMRPYDQELQFCQRYWESTYMPGVPPGTADLNGMDFWALSLASGSWGYLLTNIKGFQYRTTKRTAPTITPYNPADGRVGLAQDFAGTQGGVACNIYSTSSNGCRWAAAPVANNSVFSIGVHLVMDARM